MPKYVPIEIAECQYCEKPNFQKANKSRICKDCDKKELEYLCSDHYPNSSPSQLRPLEGSDSNFLCVLCNIEYFENGQTGELNIIHYFNEQ